MTRYIFTIIVSVAIVILSTIPIPEEAPLSDVPLIDKWVHMVMYGGLAFVMWIDHGRLRLNKTKKWRFTLLMLLYPTALGGLMELVQAYLTTCRSGDWIDFEADAVGAVVGTLCCLLLDKLWKETHLAQK